jgi:hypothetical protein
MIIDDVVWEIINNGHCSFKAKLLFSLNLEPSQTHSVGIPITSLGCAIGTHVP